MALFTGQGICRVQDKDKDMSQMTKVFLFGWAFIVLSALFDSYASFIVKMKFNDLGAIDLHSFRNTMRYLSAFFRSPLLLTAMMTFVLAPALWFLALNRVDLSAGYPTLVGFHLLFILIFGIFFLGEPLTLRKGVGVTLVLLSFYFLRK